MLLGRPSFPTAKTHLVEEVGHALGPPEFPDGKDGPLHEELLGDFLVHHLSLTNDRSVGFDVEKG
jgi:hypothetical protein